MARLDVVQGRRVLGGKYGCWTNDEGIEVLMQKLFGRLSALKTLFEGMEESSRFSCWIAGNLLVSPDEIERT